MILLEFIPVSINRLSTRSMNKQKAVDVASGDLLHTVMYITQDCFFIQPNDPSLTEVLLIDRVSQEISLRDQQHIPTDAISKPIHGIVGVIRLIAGPYLIVVTEKEKIGEVHRASIWRMVNSEMYSYKRNTIHLNETQTQDEKIYESMIKSHLATDGFYFSTTYDLTHSMQRLQNTSPDFVSISLHERADQRFVWNSHVLRELSQQPALHRYCLPILHGYIGMESCVINGLNFNYTLISRRSIFRAGTRFNMRGLDSMGQSANFVETEQIVTYGNDSCSYVQTRGSIPLYWSQTPNLKYMPLPILSASQNQTEGFQLHFDNQVYNYGRQVLVNLINHTGFEKAMENAFAEAVSSSQSENIRYVSFDFHHECGKMRWDRLSILINKLDSDIKGFGYLHLQNGEVKTLQEGVFRTNCMDCLDRTNVVQGLIAREVLQTQLQRLGVLQSHQTVSDQSVFIDKFRSVWTDNANYLSKQYAGTGALKTDFTRTGSRTKVGLLQDLVNSLTRYFKNNFYDGFRQDSIDLFLGNYTVDEADTDSPLQSHRDWKFYALPVIFLVALAMSITSMLLPAEHGGEQLIYVLFWLSASAVCLFLVFYYGKEFVDRPRLAQAKVKIE